MIPMKVAGFLSLGVVLLLLTSCGTKSIPLAKLSEPEQGLLRAINNDRVSKGKVVLKPSSKLTEIARKDAARRVGSGGGYVDHRQDTGYERMLTLAGRAKSGPEFGERLMGVWQGNPIQRAWLQGDYAGVGVGTAIGVNGLQTGVLLLGGFAGSGI